MSDEAWSSLANEAARLKYKGKAVHLGTGAYIRALLAANPHVSEHAVNSDWLDTRPESCYRYDTATKANFQHKQWFAYNMIGASGSDEVSPGTANAGRRTIAKHHYDALLAPLLEIAVAFDITHPNKRYRKIPTARGEITAVLEAIGLGHLTPKHPCPECPNPVKAANKRPGRTNKTGKHATYSMPW